MVCIPLQACDYMGWIFGIVAASCGGEDFFGVLFGFGGSVWVGFGQLGCFWTMRWSETTEKEGKERRNAEGALYQNITRTYLDYLG